MKVKDNNLVKAPGFASFGVPEVFSINLDLSLEFTYGNKRYLLMLENFLQLQPPIITRITFCVKHTVQSIRKQNVCVRLTLFYRT